MSLKDKLWVEKYRPKTLDEYVFQDSQQREDFEHMIKTKNIPHLLFTGVAGSGKTTLAQILISAMELDESDILSINASDENSVDDIREKIKGFVSTVPFGRFKIVHLEEADYISKAGQGIMRRLLEDEEYVDHSRFILTCNYNHLIIPAIKSRCHTYNFKASDRNDVAEYVVSVLAREGIKCDLDVVDQHINAHYPDVRKIINSVQRGSITGKLRPPSANAEIAADYRVELLELISTDRWQDARALCCAQTSQDEWEDVYRFLYENINSSKAFSQQTLWEEAIVVIADHLNKHASCADSEINAASMFIQLGHIAKNGGK